MAVNWSRYDECETCGAKPGEACFDMRLVRTPNVKPKVRVAIPHRGRALLNDGEGQWGSPVQNQTEPKR